MSEPVKKPIFRWAGGKSWLLKYLHKYLPDDYKNYHEPFLGGASVFFHLRSEKTSYLSDINADLINAYCEIQNNVEEVISILKQFKNTKKPKIPLQKGIIHVLRTKSTGRSNISSQS